MTHLAFLLLGLGNGAVFGALALALVLTYRSSGVLNLGAGAVALHTAYVYGFLRQGRLLLLIPGLPTSVTVGGPMSVLPAMAISIAVASLMGLSLYIVIFRPLRRAPATAKAIAALGVSLVFSSLLAQQLGTVPVTVGPIFPTQLWQVGSLRIPADRVYFALAIVLVASALTLVFRTTRFGLVTRATAETERGAFITGLSPDRVAAYNWIISSAAAGLSGILIAPIVPLVPVAYTLFIVPALAAAILARFQLILGAALVGIAIGMLQSEMRYLQTQTPWGVESGVPELVPLILMILALGVRGRSLPSRGDMSLRTLGRAPRPSRVIPVTALATSIAVAGLLLLHGTYRAGLVVSLIMSVIALSIVVVSGYSGQLSLAQLTLAGVAGFALGPLGNDLHLPSPIAALAAACAAATLGVMTSLLALRVRGLAVAVVTLALAFALEAVWFRNLDVVSSSGVPAPRLTLFGHELGIGSGPAYPRLQFGLLCLVVLLTVAVGVATLRRSSFGSQLLAIRANERAAAAAGVHVVRAKILVFALGALIAGSGGALLAWQQQTVTFNAFSVMSGLTLFATVYLAGITSISGGILAGFAATGGLLHVIVDRTVGAGLWYMIVSGVLMIAMVILNPEGIVGPAHARLAAARARLRPLLQLPHTTTQSEVRAATPNSEPVLVLRGVGVCYGGVVAVNSVDMTVIRGSIVGLIGPNGAGKTTLIDAISGFAAHTGQVFLSGRTIERSAPHERVRAGLGRTFQALDLYDDLSVAENVAVGLTASLGRRRSTTAEAMRRTFELLELEPLRDCLAGELSQGQRQLVSIARALVGEPAVLLLDEPAGGLDGTETQWLRDRLVRVANSGVTIIMVDHDVNLVLGLCDQVHVLDFGSVIASGGPDRIRSDSAVIAAYLGDTCGEKTQS
ncbi:ATP-binding cassette domain-containing protein [Nocardia sp. NPDC004168]|uniref:ABC transporter permease subunit n=1 Tax=Nocardia sp. NPDC004168 TaxID=3154452 RepID=UPI0033AD9149